MADPTPDPPADDGGTDTSQPPCPDLPRHSRRTDRSRTGLCDCERARIRAQVLTLPPLTDDQADTIAAAIIAARVRDATRRRTPPGR